MGRRRNSGHRNMLYEPPSWWGIGFGIAIVIAVIGGMIAVILL